MASSYNPIVKLDETVQAVRVRSGAEVLEAVNPYRCEGRVPLTGLKCMLVWDHPSSAIACAEHGHRSSFRVFYGSGEQERSYVRKALRRDGSTPVVPATLEPVAETPATDPTVQALMAQVAALTAQIAELSKPKARKPKAVKAPVVQDLSDDLPF